MRLWDIPSPSLHSVSVHGTWRFSEFHSLPPALRSRSGPANVPWWGPGRVQEFTSPAHPLPSGGQGRPQGRRAGLCLGMKAGAPGCSQLNNRLQEPGGLNPGEEVQTQIGQPTFLSVGLKADRSHTQRAWPLLSSNPFTPRLPHLYVYQVPNFLYCE